MADQLIIKHRPYGCTCSRFCGPCHAVVQLIHSFVHTFSIATQVQRHSRMDEWPANARATQPARHVRLLRATAQTPDRRLTGTYGTYRVSGLQMRADLDPVDMLVVPDLLATVSHYWFTRHRHWLRCPVSPRPRCCPWHMLVELQCFDRVAAFLLGMTSAVCTLQPTSAPTLAWFRVPAWSSVRLRLLRLRPCAVVAPVSLPAPDPALHACACRHACTCPPLCVGALWPMAALVWRDVESFSLVIIIAGWLHGLYVAVC